MSIIAVSLSVDPCMARLIDLKTFTDTRGNLTVIEKVIPFDIKRIFYIYGVDDSRRGGHRHRKLCKPQSASREPVRSITMTGLRNRYSGWIVRINV